MQLKVMFLFHDFYLWDLFIAREHEYCFSHNKTKHQLTLSPPMMFNPSEPRTLSSTNVILVSMLPHWNITIQNGPLQTLTWTLNPSVVKTTTNHQHIKKMGADVESEW